MSIFTQINNTSGCVFTLSSRNTPNQIFILNELHSSRWSFTRKNGKNIERTCQAFRNTRTMLAVHRRTPPQSHECLLPQLHVTRHRYPQNLLYNLHLTLVHILFCKNFGFHSLDTQDLIEDKRQALYLLLITD
jgi:hypothetical protein